MKIVLSVILLCSTLLAAGDVLIVADEFPAMQTLAAKLEAAEGIRSTIVKQTGIPSDVSKYSALIVYIHRNIGEPAEKVFVDYANAGGKLVLLHHSISSGKRANKYWFPFLKIALPEGDVAQGGYKWIDPVTLDIVNLAPKEYITSHKVKYPSKVAYTRSDSGGGEKTYPGFRLEETEVYLNHVFQGDRTILLGLKYTDPKTGKVYMQDRAGWYMRAGKGTVVYLMAGHSAKEFEHPAYSRIVVNAVAFKPRS